MCIFTGEVGKVNNTRIFAREVEAGVQGLVYQMDVSASKELAMVLPLPVKTPAWEKAVRFVNLEDYEDFFENLNALYPSPDSLGWKSAYRSLEVIEVGSYIASFVPTLDDFAKLDKRFQVSKESWAQLPQKIELTIEFSETSQQGILYLAKKLVRLTKAIPSVAY